MKDTALSGEMLLQHANALAQTFGQLTVSIPKTATTLPSTTLLDSPKSPELEAPTVTPAEKDPDWKLF
jgi:hypothetical protein